MAFCGFCLHRCDGENRLVEGLLEVGGVLAGADVEPGDLFAIGTNQPGDERRVLHRVQMRQQGPVFAGDEFLDFKLALADQPQGHRLHPAGRARARQLAPQYRREVEANEIIQRPAGEIGIDQAGIDLARVFHGVAHGIAGDGVEHDALDRLAFQHLFLLQHFQHMPGNRLALAVGIGRQNDAVGLLHRLGNVGQALGRLGIDLPEHGEIAGGINRAILGGQIADMAERGVNLVSRPKVFVDRLGLGRRFDDDDIHGGVLSLRGLRPGILGLVVAGTWGRGGAVSMRGVGNENSR